VLAVTPGILFFKVGTNSQKNPFIARELERGFPEAKVRTVDVVEDIVLRSPVAAVGAFAESLARRGWRILRHRHNPTMYFPPLASSHRAIQAWLRTNIRPAETLFAFANQSLFEASTAGVPHFVYTDHTHLANARYPGQPFTPDRRWLARERQIYERATRCFTTSNFARRSIIEDYSIAPERVHCVYSGANAAAGATPPEREEFHRRILFVGVEWERKGGPELAAAFADVRRTFPDAELWIAGCTPHVEAARIFGRLPVAELGRLYAEADIFCLPSRKDPSAIALGEAALAGLPIVATDVGGSSDRVLDGESGYLIAPGDHAALADRLRTLLGDPTRCAAMGRRGFALAQERFTWAAVGDRLTRHIREALAK
jgi:glycosyltransferase involved in cell wall biosynthesis